MSRAARLVMPGPKTNSKLKARANGTRATRRPAGPMGVVGLGASAGGIAVLQHFFEGMPNDSGLAFVVVMHLSPEHESNLASIIQQKTAMPVMQVNKPVKVKPNQVYVIPPNHQLTFAEGLLQLVEPQQALGRRVTIDLFFRTLAQAYGQRGVGVVLSGTDTDGAIGVKHIRAQGGVTIAQDPNEAEHNSMPLTAIGTGMIDWVLPVAEMPAKLLEFVQNEQRMKLPPEIPEVKEPDAKVENAPSSETVSDETQSSEHESALSEVLAHLRAQTGHDFAHYKRATVLRRIARRLQVNSLETIPHYLEFLRKHAAEVRALLQDLLIGVTHFFRDQESFAALEANIPQLFAGKQKKDEIRVWVAGCATGEEAYSIAMLFCEHAERLESPPAFQIFATDIDEQAVAEARDGLYPGTIEADVSQERLRRFFAKDHGRYRARKTLREKVLFAVHNLLSDAPFSRLDLVSCRNLLIYLTSKAQEQVFDIFHFALRAGGLLFIGGSESSTAQGLFSPVDAKQRLYVRRSVPRPAWKVPLLPLHAGEAGNRARVPMRTRALPALGQKVVENAATKSDESLFLGQARRAALFGELHLKLLEQYAPPSVVVNEEHEVVHLSEKAGRYLHFSAGEPSANLFRLINPALQIELRTALFRASHGDELTVTSAPQTVHFDGRSESISLQVRRVASTPAEKFYLILFQKEPDPALHPAEPTAHGDVTRSLDEEINYLKQQLSSTVEQYDAGNEELKASNEELQAINEELRSATEELETSQEELRSVNEELGTVNSELKSNVEDLSRSNTDLSNLMSSTDIGTIFLNRQLRIHRFTPSAQKIFNLLPADLGRPLTDITTHKLDYGSFLADAEEVLDRLSTIEREVRQGDPATPQHEMRWYLSRIAPYRTSEDRIAGVVATFVDITRRKRAEEGLRTLSQEMEHQLQKFSAIMAAVPDFLYQFDLDGRFTYVSQSLLNLWQLSLEEAMGKNFHELAYPPELATKLQRQIEEVIETRQTVKDQTAYTSAFGSRMYEYIFFPLCAADGNLDGVGGVTRDITEWRQAEERLQESQARFRNVADNIPQVIWTNDANGKANYFNRRWFEYSGLSEEESVGPGWQAIVHPADEPASTERWRRALAKGEVFDAEYRLRGADGSYRWFIGRNVPLRNDGEVLRWFGTATDIEDLKQAQARLREIEQRFELLVEGTPDYAMFLLDPENKITYWSVGAEKIFGWSAEEAVGQDGELIFTPEEKAKGTLEKEMSTAFEQGSAPDKRWHLREDGSRIWVDGVMRRVDNIDGSLRGYAKIARNATDERHAADELQRSRDELEERVIERTAEINASKHKLEIEIKERAQVEQELLLVSEREKRRIGQDLHDSLCQELAAAAFFLQSTAHQMEKKNAGAAETLADAAKIVNANVGLARDLARGLHPVELSASGLTNALRELAFRTSLKPVQCVFECPRPIRLRDDAVALNLYRIAQEAVTNSLKNGKANKIVIHLERRRQRLVLTVADNGLGFTLKNASKGMGIHIMKYRANTMGATFAVESKPGEGTVVSCTLPRI